MPQRASRFESLVAMRGGPHGALRVTEVLDKTLGIIRVEAVTLCFSRLRLVLRDDAVADDAAIGALPDVVMVLRQGGQLQVAVRSGVLVLHAEVVAPPP